MIAAVVVVVRETVPAKDEMRNDTSLADAVAAAAVAVDICEVNSTCAQAMVRCHRPSAVHTWF